MSYLGIDIGGTNLVIGIFDENIILLNKEKYHTNIIRDDYFNNLTSLIDAFKKDDLKGIGIGVPGKVSKDGYIYSLTNLEFSEHDLRKKLENYYNIPVVIINDANAAMLGEYYYNGLAKEKTYCMITLGTGVGGGIIINGELLVGNRGFAGEIGHIQLDSKKRFRCNCKNIGCSETITSAIGYSNLYRYYKRHYPQSLLNKCIRVNSKTIMEAAELKDDLALRIRNEVIYNLAKLCKEVSNVIDVDRFIFGGGISKNTNIVEMIEKRYSKMVNHDFNPVVFSKAVLEDDAGIYGAAYYIKKRKDEFYESNKSKKL